MERVCAVKSIVERSNGLHIAPWAAKFDVVHEPAVQRDHGGVADRRDPGGAAVRPVAALLRQRSGGSGQRVKVLVTGAAGLLGQQVVSSLVACGHVVVPHDRDVGDLASLSHVRTVVDGVDAVVHTAAIPDPMSTPDDETFRNNVLSTYNVLDTAGRAGIGRVVNVSSLSALGFAWSQREVSPVVVPVTEEHPYVGEDAYGLSKQVGETVASAASRRWDMA